MAIDEQASNLATVNHGVISKQTTPLVIGQLEHALLDRFPAEDAESWDRMGLLVGDPTELVTGVMVALDPTPAVVDAAKTAGANVVLTHHPAFLEPPETITPAEGDADFSGVVLWEAITNGVALMNIHTALDVSHEATQLLPSLLNLDYKGVLVGLEDDPTKGYGQVCEVSGVDNPLRLEQLAARCVSVFGAHPRVWGAPASTVSSIVIANGSAGNLAELCVDAGYDCLICGEIRYHSAVAAAQSGLDIIEIGHDVSELPLCALLAQAAVDAGVSKDAVTIFEQTGNWYTPEARRA